MLIHVPTCYVLQEEVASVVKKEMENPNRRKRRSRPDDFVDVFEDTGKLTHQHLKKDMSDVNYLVL